MVTDDYRDKRFLIVDDFESFQHILKRLLHDLNVKSIDTAINASKALKLCEEKQYDVIFCDFDLGKGQNGLQLLEELRHKRILSNNTSFIIVTADSSRDSVVGSLEYKPDAYMNKPISSAELKSRLIKCLKQKNELSDISDAIDENNLTHAIELCNEKINSGSKQKNWCLKTKSQLLLQLKKWDEAEALFKSILKNRHLFWAQLGYADVLAAKEHYSEALEAYRLAYQENSASLEAYEGAARMLINLGNPQEAQLILEQISHISSRSVSRQKLLADVSKINGDFDTAAKAARKVVRLAENSIHKTAENELDLADSLTEAALHSSDITKSKEYAKEAISTLQQSYKDTTDQDIKIQSKLIESRAYSSINDENRAQQALASAEKRMTDKGHTTNLRTQLERVKSHLQSGDKNKANELLTALAEQYQDNPEVSAMLDRISDEPISKSGKADMVKTNKEGIGLFDAGDYLAATKCFLKATKNFPRHLGLRLNTIQALIFQMKKDGLKPSVLHQCEQHLSVIKGIKQDHPQYKRYTSIKTTLDTLNKSLNTGSDHEK